MGCLAIITARGGSKRIPRKNIREFLGKPIITYSINAALESCVFDEVMVSTDDMEIAEISRQSGALVPFFRSEEASSDIAGTTEVLVEVLEKYKEMGKRFEYACCIYPCAPFVTAARLREGMELLIAEGADNVFPVAKFSYPPQRCLFIRGGKSGFLYPEYFHARTQDLEPLFHDAGQFYFFRSRILTAEKSLFCGRVIPIILPATEVQDIDTEEDWLEAEAKYSFLVGKL